MQNTTDSDPKSNKPSVENWEQLNPPSNAIYFTTEEVSLRDMTAGLNMAPESRLGDRVRYARSELKLNAEALSRLTKEYDLQGTGLSPTSIARYESGESLPGARELRILCEAFQVPASWLLYGDPVDGRKNLEVSESERLVLVGLRAMMAERKDDFSVDLNHSEISRFKTQVRNEKLSKARKP